MTVTSVPAQVAPPAPAAHDGSNAPDATSGGAGDGFASMLAGAHEKAQVPREQSKTSAAHDATTKPARKHTPRTDVDADAPAETQTESDPPADPVTLALLAALAGNAPRAERADAIPTPPPADGTEIADAAPTGDIAPATAALASAPDAVPDAAPPTAVETAATPVPLPDPAASAAEEAPAPEPDAADEPEESRPGSPPTPKPAAPTSANAGPNAGPSAPASGPAPSPAATAADALAAAATAGAGTASTPGFRAEPTPKPDPVQDNAMITAATTALERAPRADAAAAAAPTAPAAPPDPPPAAQLAAVIRPLQRGADGTYQVRIEMRPPEIGRVDMRVEIRDGVIHAAIHTEHAQTADLVRSALDDLRARLDADGMQSGQFTVDAQGAGTSGRDGQADAPERLDEPLLANAPEPTVVIAPTTTSDSLLDVRI
jgi:flagellar hook-length control protein FliK